MNVVLSRKKVCSAETWRWKMIGNKSEQKYWKLTVCIACRSNQGSIQNFHMIKTIKCNPKLPQSKKTYPHNSPLGHFCEHLLTEFVVSPESSTVKVHIFWEGHKKVWRNLQTFWRYKYLVQLIEHPLLRIMNILLVYFWSIFSRYKF